jgi:CRISPR system Cascade subunit CasE
MYQSQLRLDPASAAARRDLADPYQMHRTLARVYAPDDATPPARFLWRLERGGPAGERGVVLVQAAVPGRWDALTDRAGYEVRSDKPVDTEQLVQSGRRYCFRLRANPVVTRQGKRWGLHRQDEQLDWLARQGARLGFEVEGADVSGCERIVMWKPGGARPNVKDAVLFDGVLVARDAAALRTALVDGVGHGKAFGLGMLSLARA